LVIAGLIIAGLPGSAEWAIGLLVGINMLFGGFSLIGMALARGRAELPHARSLPVAFGVSQVRGSDNPLIPLRRSPDRLRGCMVFAFLGVCHLFFLERNCAFRKVFPVLGTSLLLGRTPRCLVLEFGPDESTPDFALL
jgi:hypothetical protein